jgi:hypothetical protein
VLKAVVGFTRFRRFSASSFSALALRCRRILAFLREDRVQGRILIFFGISITPDMQLVQREVFFCRGSKPFPNRLVVCLYTSTFVFIKFPNVCNYQASGGDRTPVCCGSPYFQVQPHRTLFAQTKTPKPSYSHTHLDQWHYESEISNSTGKLFFQIFFPGALSSKIFCSFLSIIYNSTKFPASVPPTGILCSMEKNGLRHGNHSSEVVAVSQAHDLQFYEILV